MDFKPHYIGMLWVQFSRVSLFLCQTWLKSWLLQTVLAAEIRFFKLLESRIEIIFRNDDFFPFFFLTCRCCIRFCPGLCGRKRR